MRHFDQLDDADRARLFHREPESVDALGERALVATALGATLYSPATRPRLGDDVVRAAERGTVAMVLCLEDAIADADVATAELNLVHHLRALDAAGAVVPLLFVRVRAAHQIGALLSQLGPAGRLVAGFVVPKFAEDTGEAFLRAVTAAEDHAGRRVWVMPVLESAEIAHVETRAAALAAARALLEKFDDCVLAVRVGATDLGSRFGVRRSREHTVYDVGVLAAVIADVVNVFGREGGWVVSGPVWEHFPSSERLFKPQLRESPFVQHHERRLRAELLARDLDGLLREVSLDRANGLSGKTVIHPSHVAAVHALSVVSHEEWADARDVLGTAGSGGVAGSSYRNKMNESKPHAAWARRTELRARAFGVARPQASFVDLLAACLHP